MAYVKHNPYSNTIGVTNAVLNRNIEVCMREIEKRVSAFNDFHSLLILVHENSWERMDKVLSLLKDTQKALIDLKGYDSTLYIKQSTLIASIALNTIIEVVNQEQMNIRSQDQFIQLLEKCWNSIKIIDKMDLSLFFVDRYRLNRKTLKQMCLTAGINTGVDRDDLPKIVKAIIVVIVLIGLYVFFIVK